MQHNWLIIEQRVNEIELKLTRPEILQDKIQFQNYSRELSRWQPIVNKIREYHRLENQLKELQTVIATEQEKELIQFAIEEQQQIITRIKELETEIQSALLAVSGKDIQRNVIVEIRAGTGGEEASLFAADLFRMYSRYAEQKGWQKEILASHLSDRKGIKEIIFSFTGKDVWSLMQYERGVHRVQRIPVTESSGRIHTSTCSVAVLLEPEETEIDIKPEDLRIDAYRASGAGGQHVNKTSSAIRITHLPTGIVVQCQDERSQFQNRNKAMKILRARLLANYKNEQEAKISASRKAQVGTMERAEKIRTYNFPQDRVTDHRIGLTLHNLPDILAGNLDPLISQLQRQAQEQELKNITTQFNLTPET